eukprot:363691-Chlamydomonas_euryale.AAC.4
MPALPGGLCCARRGMLSTSVFFLGVGPFSGPCNRWGKAVPRVVRFSQTRAMASVDRFPTQRECLLCTEVTKTSANARLLFSTWYTQDLPVVPCTDMYTFINAATHACGYRECACAHGMRAANATGRHFRGSTGTLVVVCCAVSALSRADNCLYSYRVRSLSLWPDSSPAMPVKISWSISGVGQDVVRHCLAPFMHHVMRACGVMHV